MAVVSFSMQVVWMYLSQRRGGGGQRHQHNISPAVRFELNSSRVHLLNKIGKKKHFERKTELF